MFVRTLESFVSNKTSGHTVDTVDVNIPAPSKWKNVPFSYEVSCVTGGAKMYEPSIVVQNILFNRLISWKSSGPNKEWLAGLFADDPAGSADHGWSLVGASGGIFDLRLLRLDAMVEKKHPLKSSTPNGGEFNVDLL